MLDAGLLDNRPIDRVIGYHVDTHLPVHMLAMRPGIAMSGAHGFRVRLHGSGGHGAQSDRARATWCWR